MDINKNFKRNCPNCNLELFYSSKGHCNNANKINSLCRDCAKQKSIYKPKEEFICIVCGKQWMDWRSQLSNPDEPCCSKTCRYQHGTKPLTGQRFGKLLVCERERINKTTFYKCECDCGKFTTVRHGSLIDGSTSSCGCLIKQTRGSERKPLKDVISTAICGFYKRNAKDRNHRWELPFDRFVELINGNCHYCGSGLSNTFTWRYKYETASLPFNGVDRVDNTIGYTSDNCVSCCRTCNSAKGELSLAQFKEWALKLAGNLNRN